MDAISRINHCQFLIRGTQCLGIYGRCYSRVYLHHRYSLNVNHLKNDVQFENPEHHIFQPNDCSCHVAHNTTGLEGDRSCLLDIYKKQVLARTALIIIIIALHTVK